jgi:hypothetical protein
MNFAVDCGVNGTSPRSAEPLRVSIEANVTEDGPPPTTIEFRAVTTTTSLSKNCWPAYEYH